MYSFSFFLFETESHVSQTYCLQSHYVTDDVFGLLFSLPLSLVWEVLGLEVCTVTPSFCTGDALARWSCVLR